MDDPNQTTSFEAQLPGGTKVRFASRRIEILIWIAITAALVFNGIQTWDLRVKLELLTFSVNAMARGIREQTCLAYLSEDERRQNIGQAAACRKMGEMQ
jgi:hypothetical protein